MILLFIYAAISLSLFLARSLAAICWLCRFCLHSLREHMLSSPPPPPPKKVWVASFSRRGGLSLYPSPPIATHSNRSSTLKLHGVSVCQMTNSKGITPVLDLQNFSNFNQDYAESVSKSVNPKDSHQQRYARDRSKHEVCTCPL